MGYQGAAALKDGRFVSARVGLPLFSLDQFEVGAQAGGTSICVAGYGFRLFAVNH